MKTVFSYASPYKWPIALALALMLMELSVELIQPLLIAKIIDDGILMQDLTVVGQWGGLMLLLAFTAFISGVVNSYFAAHAAQSFGYDLRQALFQQVQAFSMATFLRFPTASLITRLTSDVTLVQNVLFMGLRIMLRAPLLVIGSLTMAFVVNAKLALFLLMGAPFLALFLVVMTKKGVRAFSDVQRSVDRVNRVIQENLQAVRLVKSFLRGAYESARFSKVAEVLQKNTVGALRMMEIILPILLFVMNGSLMIVLWFGGMEIQAGKTQVGEVVAIINYALRMTGAFSMFSFLIIIFSRAKASATRMEEILQLEEGVEDVHEQGMEPTRQKGTIAFDSVSFRYAGTKRSVLENVSFEVNEGEKLAILGATGSGKSTLLQLIPRMYQATEGQVFVDGIDVQQWSMKPLRERIGFVPQQSLLFTGTIRENIEWGKTGATLEEIKRAAHQAQIHSAIEAFPEQYDTRVGQKGVNLSGGQKQRLSIARALVRKPSIILFDDSTSALDVKTETALWEALQDERATMLVVTQKIRTAQAADRILLLDAGAVVGYGTHAQLLAQSPLYQQIVASQKEGGVLHEEELS